METRRKRQYLVRYGSLLLPFLLSVLAIVVLLQGLSGTAKAEPVVLISELRSQGKNSPLSYQTGVTTCEQTKNLVLDLNPDFEQGIGCQNHWCCCGTCICREFQPGHNSDTCARIFAGDIRDERCMLFTPGSEIISVKPGRYYDYSTWIKSDLLQGDTYLRITFWGPDWEYKGEARTTPVTGTRDWVKVTGSAQTPPGAEYARIEATVPKSSVGSVWFDDIFIGLATCLDISKSDDPDEVRRGQMLTYTIVYSNVGREKATDVWVIETYDDYVVFDHAIPDPWSDTKNIWRFAELLPEDSGPITVVVEVEEETGERGYLFNSVQILSDEIVQPISTIISTAIIPPPDGCDIVLIISSVEKPGVPEYQTDYVLELKSAGTCDGQANLVATSSQGWDVIITPLPPYTLPSRGSEKVTVSPVVPRCELGGIVDVTTITVTLNCDLPCDKTVTETTAVTTTVKRVFGVDIEPDRFETASPGDIVSFTHTVSNTGNYTDTFNFDAYSKHDWPTSDLPPVTLGPCGSTNQSADITLNVTVPCTASSGIPDTIIVTATSQSDPDAWDSVKDQISVDSGCRLVLSDPDPPQSLGLPGDVVTYIMTAWNAGTIDGVVSIAATSSPNWEIITPPTFTLPADNSTPTFVSLVVPPCTSYLSRNITSITATLSCSSGSDVTTGSVTTTVDIGAVARIEPNNTKFVTSAGTVVFVHTLTNIGNKDDTFSFEISSARGWEVDGPQMRTLGKCDPERAPLSVSIPLTVTIPTQTSHFSDTITIIAVPETQPSRSDAAFDWIRDGRVFLPLVMKNYCPPPYLRNGDFETCDPTGWEKDGKVAVVGSGECFQSCAVRLGIPGKLENSDISAGRATISQRVYIPAASASMLEFDYCLYSYDCEDYDLLEVAINELDNVVWSKGFSCPTDCSKRRSYGPEHEALPLSGYDADEVIALFFSLEYDGSCNSWAYIDNVQITQ